MKVSDVMHCGKANSVVATTSCFRDVLEEMNAKKLGAVNVVDDGRLVGLITDGDIRRLILKTQLSLPNLFLIDADRIMTPKPKTIAPDDDLENVLKTFEKYEFWVLPVVDKDQRLLGLLHLHPLLKAMIAKSK